MPFKLARTTANLDKCHIDLTAGSDESDSDGPSGDEFDAVCRDKRHRERKRAAKRKRADAAAATTAAGPDAKIGGCFYGTDADAVIRLLRV